MENPPQTLQVIGDIPDFALDSEIIFEDEIRADSIVFFQKRADGRTAIKPVDLEKLDEFDEPLFRIGRGSEPDR